MKMYRAGALGGVDAAIVIQNAAGTHQPSIKP